MKSAIEWIKCPTCDMGYSHIQPPTLSLGSGIKAFGRSDERDGLRILAVCENLHPFFIGIAEHKGSLAVYIREAEHGEAAMVYNPGDYGSSPVNPFVVVSDVDPDIEFGSALTFEELFA